MVCSNNTQLVDSIQNFKICSINVNGLSEARKRRLVFTALRKHKKSIFLLQETHCRLGNGRLWGSQWGKHLFVSETSASAGGVAVLFSQDLDCSIKKVTSSIFQRFLVVHFTIAGESYTVASVYMPTADKERAQLEVLEELNSVLDEEDGDIIFLGGDFNVAMHDSLDRSGYVAPQIPNKSFRTRLSDFLEHLDLQDVWRIQHPTMQSYTWSRSEKLARLDYIFASASFPGIIKASQPSPCSYSDHSLVSLTLRPSTQPRGKGFWKLRTNLLNRDDFCEEISNLIQKSKEDSTDLEPDLRWEFIKLQIRERSIKFSKKVQEEYSQMERELETRLLALGDILDQSKEIREEFQSIKRELLQIQLLRAREAMVRARTKWVGEGECPTKYFLNLEKQQFAAKTMMSIRDREGTLLTNPDDILNFEKSHFTAQYSRDPANAKAREDGGDEIFSPHLQPL